MHIATAPDAPNLPPVRPETLAHVRTAVADLLTQSSAFRDLDREQQRQIAGDTARIAAVLADTADPPARPGASSAPAELATAQATPRPPDFKAQAAREGAAVAGALLEAVDFPTFVANLVKGVFHAIVESSIEQMEAYGRLVADVSKSLNEFRDENVSVNQGRDHLVDQFPDTFFVDVDTGDGENGGGPRVRLRDGVDEDAAVKKVNALPLAKPVSSLDDETIEEQLVPAARTQLATSRQQLLATMVVMGINRIVVTDGRIAAKVMYDFKAKDSMRYQNSATQFDYGDQYKYSSQGEHDRAYTGGEGSGENRRDASWYSKGKYKNTAEPVLKLVSASQTSSDSSLETKASLAGSVDINFKSDYLPLEKMADSFQIGRIQDAAQPGTRGAAGPAAPAAAPAPAPSAPPAQQPAP